MTDIGEPTGHDPAPFSTDDCRCPMCAALEGKVFGRPCFWCGGVGEHIATWCPHYRRPKYPPHPLQAITDPPPVYRMGEYIADYSPLTPEEMAQVPADTTELFSHSKRLTD